MKIILELDKEQIDALEEAVTRYRDEGPDGQGWQSAELSQVSLIVEEAIKKAKVGAQSGTN